MNKLANATAAAVALLIVGLPPVLGLITEAQVRARVAEISRSGVWTAEVRSFERGWFRGRAQIDLALSPRYVQQLGSANAASGVPALDALIGLTAPLDVQLAYGPVAIFEGVHFGLSKMVARLDRGFSAVANLERSLNVPHLFEFRGRMGFFGTLAFDADVPPIDLDLEPAHVQFSGALLDGTLAGKRLTANARVDRLEFSSPTGVFTMEGTTAKVDNEIRSRYVLPGNAGFSIQRISIVDAPRGPSPVFVAAGLRVDSTVTLHENDNLLDVQASYLLDSAFVDGTEIADTSVSIAFRKLDAAALETYATTARGLAASAPSADAALRELKPVIERLLAAGPSVTLDPVRFLYDREPFTGRVEIVTNTAALAANGTVDIEDPATLLRLFDGSADVEVSKKLAQQLVQLAMQAQYANDPTITPDQQRRFAEATSGLALVALVGQGLLEDTGEAYRSALRVTNGAVTVNGTVLPFSVP